MTEISVIIPVYNVENYLRESLDCLRNESFQDAEFILVDDGSKDSSPAICDEYAESDGRFRVIHQRNGGPARARNTGMDAATGKWICFMDSDDLLRPGSLQKMYDMAQGYDVLIHGTEFIGDYDTVPEWIADASKVEDKVVEDFSVGDIFSHRGCGPVLWLHFVRADLIQKDHLRIDEDLFLGEDFAFAATYLANAKRVRFTHEAFYRYRLFRPGSLITTYKDRSAERMEQGLVMCRTIYTSVRDKMDRDDEGPMIRALVVFTFHDLHKLDPENLRKFSTKFLTYLRALNVDAHLYELDGSVLMMIGYIKGTVDGTVSIDRRSHMTAKEYWDLFSD